MNNIHTNNHHYIKKFSSVENESFEQKEINMGQNRHGKRFKCPCGFYQIRIVVYLLGLGFSLWQTAVCLEKYFQYVRSTQVSMKKSTNTYLPALGIICHCPLIYLFFFLLVVCPSFGFGFNKQFLESLNNTENDFKKGSWIGNYSLDPLDSEVEMIYRNATLDVEEGMNVLIC